MRWLSVEIVIVLWTGMVAAQNASLPHKVSRIIVEGRISTIRLSLSFTTTVRLPEAVSSVIIGDPDSFQAEHSASEPLLVFVKPTTPAAVETNLLVTTTSGRQFPFILKNEEVSGLHSAADLLVVCRIAGTSFIAETYVSNLIAETASLGSNEEQPKATSIQEDPLNRLLEGQRGRALSRLEGNRLRVGVGEVIQRGPQFIVLFTVLNSAQEPVDLLSPQIQLAGQIKSGLFKQNSRWTTVEQVPVMDFRLDKRKLDPGVRTDGLVVFERPSIKQSNQRLLLQIGDATKGDQPVLVPISFSVKSTSEVRYE